MNLDMLNKEVEKYYRGIIDEHDPLEYFSKLIAPEIAKCDNVKKAMLLMLVSKDQKDGIRHRIHIGLVGKPGTGKTLFMEWLERDFNAIYLTQDTTTSSLKGDARKLDYGIQLLKTADDRIICFDEIELMKDRETLRDVMEKGIVTYAKGGRLERYKARARVIVGSNSFKNLSPALMDRLDFIFEFDEPDKDEAKEIARKIVSMYSSEDYEDQKMILRGYIEWVRNFKPKITQEEKERIEGVFEEYFDYIGKGKTGRWIAKVMRIATAYAKLYKRDVKAEDVKVAIKMLNSD